MNGNNTEHTDDFAIVMATGEDSEAVLGLYRDNMYGPADWNEYYPNEETIEFDLARDALYVMKNSMGEVIATISIDSDEEVDALRCWNPGLLPGGELSRLCVREDMRGFGIAGKMMHAAFEVLKRNGYRSVHILVKTGHDRAIRCYSRLGFTQVGECVMFGKDFVCMEREL